MLASVFLSRVVCRRCSRLIPAVHSPFLISMPTGYRTALAPRRRTTSRAWTRCGARRSPITCSTSSAKRCAAFCRWRPRRITRATRTATRPSCHRYSMNVIAASLDSQNPTPTSNYNEQKHGIESKANQTRISSCSFSSLPSWSAIHPKQFVLSVDSLEEARSFLHDDPFRIAGLYYEVTIVRSKQEAPKSSRGNLEIK